MNRSLDERYNLNKRTHGNLIDMFQQAQTYLSIRREWMYVNTQ